MLWILEHLDQLNTEAVLSCLPRLSEARRARVQSMPHVPSKPRSDPFVGRPDPWPPRPQAFPLRESCHRCAHW